VRERLRVDDLEVLAGQPVEEMQRIVVPVVRGSRDERARGTATRGAARGDGGRARRRQERDGEQRTSEEEQQRAASHETTVIPAGITPNCTSCASPM
jgi:hypothetical protein